MTNFFDQDMAASYDEKHARLTPMVEAMHFRIRMVLAEAPNARTLCVPCMTSAGAESSRSSDDRIQSGPVIISASGMCEAGRIKHRLPNRADMVLIGRLSSAWNFWASTDRPRRRSADIGGPVPVHADIAVLNGPSAHADRTALFGLGGFKHPPLRTFVVHGEQAASNALKTSLLDELGWTVYAPVRADVIQF